MRKKNKKGRVSSKKTRKSSGIDQAKINALSKSLEDARKVFVGLKKPDELEKRLATTSAIIQDAIARYSPTVQPKRESKEESTA